MYQYTCTRSLVFLILMILSAKSYLYGTHDKLPKYY